MIDVSRLVKSFGPVRALDGISFDVPEREVCGFLGPNGAGKSTTLRILTGFLPADAGDVRIAGHDVRSRSLEVRRRIGYLPEGVPLYPEMRVSEYLRFRARLKDVPRARRRQDIAAALEEAGVSHVARRIIGTLSKGYRQRVGLADALLGRPPVLILDEPTVGLDPEQVIQFRQLLQRIGVDRTVLLSTHILSEVEIVCSGVIIIHGGRIVAQDTAENLRRRVRQVAPLAVEIEGAAGEVRRALEGLAEVEAVEGARLDRGAEATAAGAMAATAATAPETEPGGAGPGRGATFRRFRLRPRRGHDPRAAVYDLCRKRGWPLRELHREDVTLEDAFLEIVGGTDGGERGAPRE